MGSRIRRALVVSATVALTVAGATVVSAPAQAVDYGTLKSCPDRGKAPGPLHTSATCADARAAAKLVVQKRMAGAAREGLACFVVPGSESLACVTRETKGRALPPGSEIYIISGYCATSGDPSCP